MKDLFIHDEIILNQKIKRFFAFFCFLGILGSFSMIIPSVQKYFSPFVAKVLINHPKVLINWVSIFLILSLTCFFILFILTVIKKTINKYEFFILMYFIIQLLCVFSFDMDSHAQSSYLLSFRYGFAHRMLIGTTVDILSGGYVSNAMILSFVFCGTIWLIFLVSIAIGYLIIKSDDKIPILLLTVLYLSSSISINAYFVQGNLGRMEIYVLLFMLIVSFIINKMVWRWFIPVLCFMSLATHLVVVFFYIPFVFIILLYEYFNKPNQSKSDMALLIITALSIIVTFFYFVIFSKSTLTYQDEIIFGEILKNKTNIINFSSSLHYDYFLSIIDTFRYAMSRYKEGIFFRFYCIIQSLPLFLFFILFWNKCIKIEQRKIVKLIFLISMLLPVFSIPAFILFIDWGRWVIMLLTVQFMLVFYFFHRRENSVIMVMDKFTVIAKKHSFIFIIYIMLSVFMGPIWQINASTNFMRLRGIFVDVIRKIF
ncbi:MAG: hypothetical protein LBQ93_04480 [Treponema sp.]|jgi:hypothetical protein|nr:hypothetical protein [Treponema sp.]